MNIRDYGQKIIDGYLHRWEVKYPCKFVAKDLKCVLGCYSYRRQTIEVHSGIIDDADWIDTLLHEIAHAITRHGFGPDVIHGKEFKQICEILRCSGSAKSDKPFKTSYVSKYSVTCGCKTFARERLSEWQKWDISSGSSICRKCGKPFTFKQNR